MSHVPPSASGWGLLALLDPHEGGITVIETHRTQKNAEPNPAAQVLSRQQLFGNLWLPLDSLAPPRVVQCLVPMLSLWTAATTPGSSCVKAPTLSLLLTFWGRGHPWPGSLPVSLLGGRCCRAGSGPGVAASADGPGLYVSRGQRRDQPCTELGLLTKQPGSDRAFSSAHIEEPRRTATAGKAYSPATSCFGDPEPLGPLWSP
ncbi:uncharacterized protein [Marmota flaviventris]